LHSGCRTNLASVISHTNQNITLLGRQGKLEDYPDVNDKRGVSIYNKSSLTLKNYRDANTELTSELITENYNFFKNDTTLQSIDAFVCGFPASMCQLWMSFENAKIIFLPAHRYNLGKCTLEDWHHLNKQLICLSQDRKSTIGAMSRYDVEYMRYYTGLDAMMVPSYSGFYMEAYYKPKYNNYLIVTITWTWGKEESWWAKLRGNYVNSVKQICLVDNVILGF